VCMMCSLDTAPGCGFLFFFGFYCGFLRCKHRSEGNPPAPHDFVNALYASCIDGMVGELASRTFTTCLTMWPRSEGSNMASWGRESVASRPTCEGRA